MRRLFQKVDERLTSALFARSHLILAANHWVDTCLYL